VNRPATKRPESCAGPASTEHIAQRPSWDCRACTQPWPCANAKTDLLAEFQDFPSVLMIYMSAQMCEALNDLTAHGALAPPDLYDRFITWARPKLSQHYSQHAASDHSVPAQGGHHGEHGNYPRRGSGSSGAAER
jgi:hypothetical protein